MGQADAWFRGRAEMTTPETPVRDAATVILSRQGSSGPEVLMGQRGAGAAFMPNKFVFPGGAMDREDANISTASALGAVCAQRLRQQPRGPDAPPTALAATAVRELWEETGLTLAQPGAWAQEAPAAWQGMARQGLAPHLGPLRFVFRAITPPGRPRRFDARFFLADAAHIWGDADDFSGAQDELSHLQWIPLHRARSFDLPFITEVVLAEIAQHIGQDGPPDSVPFFDNSSPVPTFLRLG